jgi:hypothetical protein
LFLFWEESGEIVDLSVTFISESSNEQKRNESETRLRAMPVPSTERLQYAAESRRADKKAVLAAVQRKGEALKYAAESLKADKEVVLAAVQTNGLALQYAAMALRADKEVVLAAAQRNGYALEYAAESLKADKEVVLAAVQDDGRALEYTAMALRADKEVDPRVQQPPPLLPRPAITPQRLPDSDASDRQPLYPA